MTVSSLGTVYFIPTGWSTVSIRIVCIINNPIVRIDAWKYNGEQVEFPSGPEKRAGVYAASSLGLLIDYNIKPVRIRPRRIFRSLYRNATGLLFVLIMETKPINLRLTMAGSLEIRWDLLVNF